MEIHNLNEDLVNLTVNELFDDEEKSKRLGYCTCFQCRLDVACFALNRIKPDYVVSGRGVAHGEQDYQEKLQKTADIVTIVKDGWARINQTKRPHFRHESSKEKPELPTGPVFNFPSIMGRLFNGSNFEPLVGIQVGLYRGEGLVPMIDPNWQNPCMLFNNTAGMYVFWPYPESAESPGLRKGFSFRIFAELQGFEEISHYFELELVSELAVVDQFSMQRVHKLPDLYVFPK